MQFEAIHSPPLVTVNLPGIGGRIKVFPEDFEVEEIPAYTPSGTGEFLYLWLEKRDMGAEYFLRQIARRLEISPQDVGSAGLKDRRALTRQMVSLPAAVEERLNLLEGDGIRVLNVSRHGNKLRPGHLHGNRFSILVRDVTDAASLTERLPPLLERLRQDGLPNYYGAQRFGKDGETLKAGLDLIAGQSRRFSPFFKKLALSAVQSALFNHYLGTRQTGGWLRTVLRGDVMAKIPFGGMFVVEDVAQEQKRFDAREIVSCGPIFGRKTFPAAHDAAHREAETLNVFSLTTESFHNFGKLLQGTRRHNLVYVDDLTANEDTDGLRLKFSLPAGSYATILLREIMKTAVEAEER